MGEPLAGAQQPERQRANGRRALGILGFAGVALVFWGGYDRAWSWTGFGHEALLWDWLHVILLPLAVTVAPLWVRHGRRLGRSRHLLLLSVVAAFVVLVVLGYALPLRWTGFPGNTLWDWLELLVLPLAVVLLPMWIDLAHGVQRFHRVAGVLVLALLGVAIAGGYGYGWRWTGFSGNTLFNWLQLLVAPLLLPIVLVPFVAQWATEAMGQTEPTDAGPPFLPPEKPLPLAPGSVRTDAVA
jgi:hypothetical protein